MNNGDKPASPLDSIAESDMCGGYNYEHSGLTKREAFAMAAMQGMTANSSLTVDNAEVQYGESRDCIQVSEAAVRMADALLLALESSDA